uniref:FIP-RBD domain-containing protein n=1 Tax=Sinocyclocheilus rhinocerous TaxID=307959 RepID=A0A673K0I6_9TELE
MLTRRYCMSIKQSLVEGGGTYYHLNHSELEDLEDYIDTLLVRIMEQTPTLLQVRSMMK